MSKLFDNIARPISLLYSFFANLTTRKTAEVNMRPSAEFRNYYENDLKNLLSNDIVKQFLAAGIIEKNTIYIIQEFVDTLTLNKVRKSVEYAALNLTLQNKLGNSIGACAYVKDLLEVDEKRFKEIVIAIFSLQLLADFGDTLIDQANVTSLDVKRIYNLDESHDTVSDLFKKNINVLIHNLNSETRLVKLFKLRWAEFINYELSSGKLLELDLDTDYFDSLVEPLLTSQERLYLGLSLSLKEYGLDSVELFASKGGTTYLHNLLRHIGTGSTVRIKTFDYENTWFDWLNFASDHFVDILSDMGFESYNDFILGNKVDNVEEQFNMLDFIIKSKFDLNIENHQDAAKYLELVTEYFQNLIQKVYHIVSEDSINKALLKPMLLYFLFEDRPSVNVVRSTRKLISNLDESF